MWTRVEGKNASFISEFEVMTRAVVTFYGERRGASNNSYKLYFVITTIT